MLFAAKYTVNAMDVNIFITKPRAETFQSPSLS